MQAARARLSRKPAVPRPGSPLSKALPFLFQSKHSPRPSQGKHVQRFQTQSQVRAQGEYLFTVESRHEHRRSTCRYTRRGDAGIGPYLTPA